MSTMDPTNEAGSCPIILRGDPNEPVNLSETAARMLDALDDYHWAVFKVSRYDLQELFLALGYLRWDEDGERLLRVSNPGMARVAMERLRQLDEEGWTAEHDDEHANGSLAQAAACYAWPRGVVWPGKASWQVPAWMANALTWPWDRKWWKPKGQTRDLERSAALAVAEIERLDRAEARKAGGQ